MATVVLGLGNLLMQDDGLGVHAVRSLQQNFMWPEQVELVDGGTLGLDLLPLVTESKRLLIVDAMDMGQEPGAVLRLDGDAVPHAWANKLSIHQAGVQDLLNVAFFLGWVPQNLVVLGIQPAEITPGFGLTERITESLPQLLQNIRDELTAWGIHSKQRHPATL